MAENEKSDTWERWKTKHPRWHRLLVLELASIAGLLLVFLIWLLGVDIWRFVKHDAISGWYFWSENRDSARDLGLTLAAVIGLPLLIWREITGHRTTNIAAERHRKQTDADRERRITDSFTKAVELLGKPELEVRLGAIYALERIAHESERDYWPIIETLTAYVRTRSPVSAAGAQSVDIQAVLTVLVRRNLKHERKLRIGQRIDLTKADLRWAPLSEADLSKANLREADLREADLRETDLSGADLRGADLRGIYVIGAKLHKADLSGANLSKTKLHVADLRGAKLHKADLSGADLRWAYLIGADLIGANLSKAILRGADLRGARLHKADLSGADLKDAKFEHADFEDAKFCYTTMPDSTMNNRDCPPEPAPPNPSETPPASN